MATEPPHFAAGDGRVAVAGRDLPSATPGGRPVLRTVARAARAVYLPSVLLALASGAFAWRGVAVLGRGGWLERALLGGQMELAGPLVIGVVLVVSGCERLAPAVRRPLTARGHLHDACFLAVFAAAVVPYVTVLGAGVAAVTTSVAPWLVLRPSARLPGWLAVGAALVLMDGCNWLTHLAEHRLLALWRVHALHHSQEELSVLTTFRTHPLSHTASTVAATLPVVALTGYHPMTPVLITVYLLLAALPHANVGWTFGPLGKVLVSPAYHRLHHRAAGPQGVNLGIVLVVFDVLARRAVFPARGLLPCPTGLADRPLAVEQEGASYRPARLLATQLLEPLRRPY